MYEILKKIFLESLTISISTAMDLEARLNASLGDIIESKPSSKGSKAASSNSDAKDGNSNRSRTVNRRGRGSNSRVISRRSGVTVVTSSAAGAAGRSSSTGNRRVS